MQNIKNKTNNIDIKNNICLLILKTVFFLIKFNNIAWHILSFYCITCIFLVKLTFFNFGIVLSWRKNDIDALGVVQNSYNRVSLFFTERHVYTDVVHFVRSDIRKEIFSVYLTQCYFRCGNSGKNR